MISICRDVCNPFPAVAEESSKALVNASRGILPVASPSLSFISHKVCRDTLKTCSATLQSVLFYAMLSILGVEGVSH